MSQSSLDSVHVNWTEDRLLREIAELEMSLAEEAVPKGSEPDWRRFLITHSLENRRRMLSALLGTARTPAPASRARRDG
jgi:hypothetical protein